jgi:hypothetical protein
MLDGAAASEQRTRGAVAAAVAHLLAGDIGPVGARWRARR